MTTVLRTTARLDEEEAALVVRLKNPDSAEAAAVRELTGMEDLKHAPAATIVHIMIEAGIQAIREKALDISYQRAAEADAKDPDRQAWRSAMRGRHLRPFMDAGAA